jgi:outer membrane protein assembly factor BamB
LWRKQSIEDYQGLDYKFDTTMSPLLAQGLCIVHLGNEDRGMIMAFDLNTGQRRWICDKHSPAYASPALITIAGVPQVVILSDKTLLGLALNDGKPLWQIPFVAESGNNTTPVIYDHQVILSGLGHGVVAFNVKEQEGEFSISQQWNNPTTKISPRFTTPVIKDGHLFGYGSRLYCLDLKTQAILWMSGGNLGNSVALVDAGEVMVALGVKGELVIYKPVTEQYQELARYSLSDKECWAHPIVTDNRIFVRDIDTITLWTIANK